LLQSKLVWLAAREAIPQLSLLPPSMSAATMVATADDLDVVVGGGGRVGGRLGRGLGHPENLEQGRVSVRCGRAL
jgi:hypothetical protein